MDKDCPTLSLLSKLMSTFHGSVFEDVVEAGGLVETRGCDGKLPSDSTTNKDIKEFLEETRSIRQQQL